ncbi:MAG: hypothetical protein KDD70_01370 [Bdellovibrionales bacterium]|nr:hypothetical protein [Bdellovibrionales bacterium]
MNTQTESRDRFEPDAGNGNRERIGISLPEHFEPYTDKYFLRTAQILEAEGLNPTVRAQVFIRKGPGEVAGVAEALESIQKYAPDFEANGGKIYALQDGTTYQSKDTQMLLEGPLQDIVALETIYLGILSKATTSRNDGIDSVDLGAVTERMKKIVELANGRPVSYFGARHWDLREDAAIARAAFEGGANSCSTDIGAATFGSQGVGTIPHVLENAMATLYGKDRAVLEATLAFDRHIDPSVPRIALIDYNNKEISDSLAVAVALGEKLYGVRVDTPGENVAEGALKTLSDQEADAWRAQGIPVPSEDSPDAKYWAGTGVTISGVYALRKALDEAGHRDTKIILTSGFGNPEKVAAFVRAEEALGITLFDGLGVGGLYPSRAATMDVVGVQDELGQWSALSKVGRSYRPNENLRLVLGEEPDELQYM